MYLKEGGIEEALYSVLGGGGAIVKALYSVLEGGGYRRCTVQCTCWGGV